MLNESARGSRGQHEFRESPHIQRNEPNDKVAPAISRQSRFANLTG